MTPLSLPSFSHGPPYSSHFFGGPPSPHTHTHKINPPSRFYLFNILYYSPTWRYCAHYEDATYNPYNVGSSKRGNGRKCNSPHDQHVSEPATYMELQPRPSEGQSHALPEYKSLLGTNKSSEYYNVPFNKGNKRDKREQLVGNAQCWIVLFHSVSLTI